MTNFTNLHVHTDGSPWDGLIKAEELIDFCLKNKMDSCAITDHGSLLNLHKFLKLSKKKNFKPIVGVEAYVTDTHNKPKGPSFHLVLLAKDNTGYKNLIRLMSEANINGFYRKPRIDKDLLKKYSKGLVCLTACIGGELPQCIIYKAPVGAVEFKHSKTIYESSMINKNKSPEDIILEYLEIFGKEDLYLEVMVTGDPAQDYVNKELLRLGKKLGLKTVLTPDAHYLVEDDKILHDILLAAQTKKTLKTPTLREVEKLPAKARATTPYRMSLSHINCFMITPEVLEEMLNIHPELLESAKNTLLVKEKCAGKVSYRKKPTIPQYDKNKDSKKLLNLISKKGLLKKLSITADELWPLYKDRMNTELEVINNMGFADYFLMIADLVNWCEKQGFIVGCGRGSSAGSLVSYALNITKLDPIQYGLLFERMLNAGRKDAFPDIDLDFSPLDIEKIIAYLKNKYGEYNVAEISTVTQRKAKIAIKDVAPVFGFSFSYLNNVICNRIPDPGRGKAATFKFLEDNATWNHFVNSQKKAFRDILPYAKQMEDTVRNTSKHAGGVIISKKPIYETVPLIRLGGKNGDLVTGYTMNDCEEVGLVKVDLLRTKAMETIKSTLELIENTTGEVIDINKLNVNDKNIYSLYQKGNTRGLFQFDNASPSDKYSISGLAQKIQVQSLDDLSVVNALSRPGPKDNKMHLDYIRGGPKKPCLPSSLSHILEETRGLIIYQEQVMQISKEMAGFTLQEADILRKAMGKKDPKEMTKMKKQFVEGVIRNGFKEAEGQDVFDIIEKFSEYGFNKSHSYSYSYISLQTAFLKYYYPAQFFAATINSKLGTDKQMEAVQRALRDARITGVQILKPTVNTANYECTVYEGKLVLGFGIIKSLGESFVKKLCKAREQKGFFTGIIDFMTKIEGHIEKSKTMLLIKSGAMDEFEITRYQMIEEFESKIVNRVKKYKEEVKTGQIPLFSSKELPNEVSKNDSIEFSKEELIKMENQTFGFFINNHPLSSYKKNPEFFNSFCDVDHLENKTKIGIYLYIKNIEEKKTYKGANKMVITAEDIDGTIVPITVFQNNYAEIKPIIQKNTCFLVLGNKENRGIIGRSIKPLVKIT